MTTPQVPERNSRVLIVEDNWLIAEQMADALRGVGIEVLGPVGTVDGALALMEIAARESGIGAAVLDIDLQGEPVTPVAEALAALGVPFLYATGYRRGDAPGVRDDAPWLEKPVATPLLIEVLRTMGAVETGTLEDALT